jgi:DNA-binding LytR/AlgR family response regulator
MSEVIKCMVVDDEPLAVSLLSSYVELAPNLILVATAQNPIEAIQLLKDTEVDLLFLDIQMPVLNRLELVRTLHDPPDVIFTTAYRDYAVESYELGVVDYLMKPITMVRFLQAIEKYSSPRNEVQKIIKAEEGETKRHDDKIYVNVNKRYVKVVFGEIKYVESVKDYIHIHTTEETIITKDKLSEFESKLPSSFLRIHRSFIVNMGKVTAFTSHDVELGTKELPIGASYKEEVLTALK